MGTGYAELPNELVSVANGVDYAYRDTGGGESEVPLVLLQHFRGNLDNRDLALIDTLALARRIVTPYRLTAPDDRGYWHDGSCWDLRSTAPRGPK